MTICNISSQQSEQWQRLMQTFFCVYDKCDRSWKVSPYSFKQVDHKKTIVPVHHTSDHMAEVHNTNPGIMRTYNYTSHSGQQQNTDIDCEL